MRRSNMSTKCRVEYKTITKDDEYGSAIETWALLGVRYCSIQDVLPSRAETVDKGMTVATNQSRLRMNYATDIDSSMRIIINQPMRTVFNIISGPAVLGDKEEIELMIEKVSA